MLTKLELPEYCLNSWPKHIAAETININIVQ